MRRAACILVLSMILLPSWGVAGGLPWAKSLAKGVELPRPYGIGIDVFDMNHDYSVDRLGLNVMGQDVEGPNGFEVENRLTEINVKLDAWVLPFLNVFALVGDLDGLTVVDLSENNSFGIPIQALRVEYSGLIYGGGMTLTGAFRQRYFGSLTASFTETDLSGDFESSVETITLQPRVGIYGDGGSFWIGGMWIDADERHIGSIPVPFLGAVGFDISLSEAEAFHWTIGASFYWTDRWQITMEGGVGGRNTVLVGLARRF